MPSEILSDGSTNRQLEQELSNLPDGTNNNMLTEREDEKAVTITTLGESIGKHHQNMLNQNLINSKGASQLASGV